MKAYYVMGRYLRTQEEARAYAKENGAIFDPATNRVDIPTDAEGLIDYLNLVNADRILTPAPEPKQIYEIEHKTEALSYAERSVGGDRWFEGLPVEHMLTLTSLALENARAEIGRLKAMTR